MTRAMLQIAKGNDSLKEATFYRKQLLTVVSFGVSRIQSGLFFLAPWNV